MDGEADDPAPVESTHRAATHAPSRLLGAAAFRTPVALESARLGAALGWIAALLALGSAFHSFYVPLTPGRMARPTAELIPALPLWSFVSGLSLPGIESGVVVGALLILTAAGMFGLYGLAIALTWRRPASRGILGIILAASFIFVNIALWALPNTSTDIYNYILRGRVGAVYGENPYVTAADHFPADPIYPYASQRYTVAPGGKFPTWMLLNISLARIAGDDPITNLMLYRSVLALMALGGAVLVAMILRELSPQHLLAGSIAFAWNPIVTLFGPQKTDSLMVVLLLLGVYLLVRRRNLIAVLPLALSCFVKLVSLPLVGILLARRLLERQWAEALIGGALLAATAALVYMPFSDGFDLLLQHLLFTEGKGGAAAGSVIQPIVRVLFFGVVAWAVFRKPRTLGATLQAWAVTLLYFSLFLTNFAFAWYLMIFAACSAVAHDGRIVAGMVILCMSSFVINTWNSTSSSTFPLGTLSSMSRHVAYLLPLVVAGGALSAFALWRRARARRGARA